ncbi:MAG: VCBS domain-containing protein [Pseudomonadota bacterium]|nr:VCBS domain-containing protein [Pseudomonadota bacterium]
MAFLVGKILDVKGLAQVQSSDYQNSRLVQPDSEISYQEVLFLPNGSRASIQLVTGNTIELIGQATLTFDQNVVPLHYLDNLPIADVEFFESILKQFLDNGVEPTLSKLTALTDSQSILLKSSLDSFEAIEDQQSEQSSSTQQAADPYFSSSNQQASQQERLALEGKIVAGFETVTRDQVFDYLFNEVGVIDRDSVVFIPELTFTGDDSVMEGELASYTLTLDIPPAFGFSVTVDISPVSAQTDDLAVASQTIVFSPGQLSATFSVESFDDFVADSGETYRVEVVGSNGGGFSKQPEIPAEITTQILDDSQPNTPYNSNDTIEADTADTIDFTLYALDDSGYRVDVNQVKEGAQASYIIIATDKDGNELELDGTLQVDFSDFTATGVDTQTQINGTEDYLSTSQIVNINQVFTVDVLDDYLADSAEQFQVSLQAQSYSLAEQYESIAINSTPIETTIVDDSQSDTPNDDSDAIESSLDSVTVKLVTTDSLGNEIVAGSIAEGGSGSYKAVLLDSEGNLIGDATGTVDILLIDGSAVSTGNSADGELDFSVTNQTVALGTVFSVDILDDYIADADETFQLQLIDDSYSHDVFYENVVHDTLPIITTIEDDSGTPTVLDDGPEADHESVVLKLVALDETGNEVVSNTVSEADDVSYKVVLEDENGNRLNSTGQVTVSFGALSDSATADEDYSASNQVVTIGDEFTVATVDDFITDNSETFIAQIVDGSFTDSARYENVVHYLTSVETSITDGLTEADGGTGLADTIYVKLTGSAIVDEVAGSEIVHNLSLVDQNGNAVNLPVGETIELTISYTDTFGVDGIEAEDFLSPLITALSLTGDGGSSYNFINTVDRDDLDEGDEGYTASIGSIDGHSGFFENIAIDNDNNSVTALIQENLVLRDDTSVDVAEGSVTITDATVGNSNLLDNDIELGQNGRITSFEYVDEFSATQTATLVAGTATADTQYGSLTINEGGSWSFTSDSTEDHSVGVLTESIIITVTDDNSKTATSAFSFDVTDTAPIANNDNETTPRLVVEGAAAITGNVIDNAIDDSGDDVLGVDATQLQDFTYLDVSGTPTLYTFGTSDTGVDGTHGAYKTVLTESGSLTVYIDGEWSFTPASNLDHSSGLISADFEYTLVDSDGSTSDAIQFIEIEDSANPIITDGDVVDSGVNEENLTGGSAPETDSLTVTGVLGVSSAGADTFDVTFDPDLATGSTGLLSGGVDVVFNLSDSDHTLTATAATVPIFTVNLTNSDNSSAGYSFTLHQPLDHADALGENTLALNFDFIVTDSDGDSVTNQFTVTVTDDIPTAVSDTGVITEDAVDNTLSANIFDNDTLGADTLTTPVTGVAVGDTGVDATGNVGSSVTGTYGSIVIDSDGDYIYTLDNADSDTQALTTGQEVTEIFTYTITDEDGDTSNSTLTITITGTNDAPVLDLDSNDSSVVGTGYETTFNEDASAIPIVDTDIDILDVDDTNITSATIVLTNALTDDVLSVAGVDAKFTPTVDISVPGEVTITLTGDFSLADYQTAMQAITFSNTSQAPNETDRIIEISVNDGEANSNTAISTIHVNATPDLVDNSIEVIEGSGAVSEATVDANVDTTEGNLLSNDDEGTPTGTITAFTYTNASGDAGQVGTVGVEATTQYGKLTLNADGTWSYTPNASVDNTGGATPNDVIVYTVTDGNGDSSTANFTVILEDGPDPTITPVDQTVSEDSLGLDTLLVPVEVSATLGVVKGSDSIVTTFTDSQTALIDLGLSSAGDTLNYAIDGTGTILTATTAMGGETIFTVTITDHTSESAAYDFKLFSPIDHPNPDHGDSWVLPFDVVVTDSDGDENTVSFNVTVNDSVPNQTPLSITTDEDTALTFRISQDSLSELKITAEGQAEAVVASGGSIDLYDGGLVIGQLTNQGDGTLTFTPVADYSGTPSFDYVVTDFDGDVSASTTVSITVTPVADAPGWTAHAGVTTNEDTMADLGLTMPTIADNTDKNSTDAGDHGERLGYIALGSVDAGVEIYKGDGTTLLFTGANDTMTVVIVTAPGVLDTSVHYSDLDLGTAIQLTQAEFEALKLLPVENAHNDIDLTLNVTSYEVDDSGNKLPAITGVESTEAVHIEVLAVTDAPTLDLTPTGYVIDEDTTLTLTSDLIESLVDVDSSEQMWFEITGLVEGSTVSIGSTIYVADAGGNIDSSANKMTVDEAAENPALTITPPEHYSGDMGLISVVLKTQDSDADSTVTTTAESSTVNFTLSVDPVADDSILDDLTMVEDIPSKLFASLETTETNGSETITQVVINDLPADWVIKDESGVTLLTGDGITDLTIDAATVGLTNLQNYTLTPPAHSSADITLDLDITVLDIEAGRPDSTITYPHTQVVTVSPVAELNTTDTGGAVDNDVITQGDHTYVTDALEDIYFNLNTADSGFGLSATNEDSGETTTVLFVAKDGDGVDLIGTVFEFSGTVLGYTGSPVEIPIDELANLQVKGPDNYSGQLILTTQIQTVDSDDDVADPEAESVATLTGDTLTINVAAVADNATLSLAQVVVDEDAGRTQGNVINSEGVVNPGDIDDPAGGEVLNIKVTSVDESETFKVVINGIPGGGALYFVDASGNTLLVDETGTLAASGVVAGVTVTDNGDSTWQVSIEDYDNAYPPKFIPPHNSDEDYNFDVTAQTQDDGLAGTDSDVGLKITVNGVADVPQGVTLNVVSDHGVDYQSVYSENTVDTTNSINFSDIYTASNPNSDIKSYDSDSEQLSIVITGLSSEFDIEHATFLGGSGTDRRWSVASDEVEAVNILVPENFSGELPFSVQYITTEISGASKTHTGASVSVWITPEQDSVINTVMTQYEDIAQKLDFSVESNGDTNESLSKVYILEASIPAGVTLSLDGGSDLAIEAGSNPDINLVDGYYEITGSAIHNIVSTLPQHSDTNYNLTVKYEVTDQTNTLPDVPSVTVSADMVYAVSVSAVADVPTIELDTDDNQHTLDIDNDGTTDSVLTTFNETINGQNVEVFNVENNTTAHITFNLASDDLDGSEAHDFYELTNVPDGVQIEGAAYGGEGTWYLPATGSTTSGISTEVIQLYFSSSVDLTVTSEIQVIGHNVDSNGSVNQSAPISIFIGDQNIGGGGSGGGGSGTAGISSSPITLDEDSTLSITSVFTISSDADTNFTLHLSGVPTGASVSNAFKQTLDDGSVMWVINKDSIASATITFPENYNQSGASFDLNGTVVINEADGSTTTVVTDPAAITITPITDELVIEPMLTSYDATSGGSVVSDPQEDGRTEISIDMTTVDTSFNYVDGAGDPVTEVTLTTDNAVSGTLYNTITGDAYTPVGNDWTIPITELDELRFVPDLDQAGLVTFSMTVNVLETGATNIVSQTKEIAIDITPVNDGYSVTSNSNVGSEEEFVLLDLVVTSLDSDGSEKLFAVIIDNVPDGVLLYYTVTTDHDTIAQNTGSTDGGLTNSWSIPLIDGALPEVWIKAPENWSGDVNGMNLNLYSSEASDSGVALNPLTLNSTTLDATINPLADTLVMMPTDTFGREGGEIPINLNISIDDIDGSETVSFTLTGNSTTLEDGVTFKVGGVEHGDVAFDSGTYTISNVPYESLSDIVASSLEGFKGEHTVDVTAWTVDGASDTSATPQVGSFTLSLTPHASGVTAYSVSTLNIDNSANYITAAGYQIPLVITGLDLADKDGSETLSIQVSGLSSSLVLDETTLPTGVTASLNGSDWIIELGSPLDGHYDAALTALENGEIQFITTEIDGLETDGFTVLAYSTQSTTGETNSDIYDVGTNTNTPTAGETVTVNFSRYKLYLTIFQCG